MRRVSNNPAGRPHSRELTEALQQAAIDLIAEGGYRGVSMDAIAKRAGASRPALYRRFGSVAELVLSALEKAGSEALVLQETENLAADLESYFCGLVRALDPRGSVGLALRAVLSEAIVDQVFAERFRPFIDRRRQPVAARLRMANPQMEEAERDELLDLLFGPIFYRMFVRQVPVSCDQARAVVRRAMVIVNHTQP